MNQTNEDLKYGAIDGDIAPSEWHRRKITASPLRMYTPPPPKGKKLRASLQMGVLACNWKAALCFELEPNSVCVLRLSINYSKTLKRLGPRQLCKESQATGVLPKLLPCWSVCTLFYWKTSWGEGGEESIAPQSGKIPPSRITKKNL